MVEQDRYKTLKEQTGASRWQEGQSGNPKGRPKHSVTTLLKNQDELTTKAICDKLVELARKGDLPAIREYLDRTDGKVTDTHKFEGDIPVSIVYKLKEKDNT